MTNYDVRYSVPVVNVEDLAASINFYTGELGFEVMFQIGAYAGIRLGGAELHLNNEGDDWAAYPTSVRINLRGIDDYYNGIKDELIKADEKLKDMPFGSRQFSVIDPSGNRVTFAQYED